MKSALIIKPSLRFVLLNPDHTYREVDAKRYMYALEEERHANVALNENPYISTVFYGAFYWKDPGPFETMYFDAANSIVLQRYKTWEEAEMGHNNFVEVGSQFL